MAIHASTPAWEIPSMDAGAWQATVHGVAKSWTQLSDFTFISFSQSSLDIQSQVLFSLCGTPSILEVLDPPTPLYLE